MQSLRDVEVEVYKCKSGLCKTSILTQTIIVLVENQ